MSDAAANEHFPMLFLHSLRKEWGVSVVSGEHDGKRSYLFEGGEERTMSAGALPLMHRVEHPDQGQQAAYARLQALLAKRLRGKAGPVKPPGSILPQLRWFRERYPKGLLDEQWVGNARRERARRTLDASIAQAHEVLSQKTIDGWLKLERYETVWKNAHDVLASSGIVDVAPLNRPLSSEQLGLLAKAVRKLLYASSAYEQRFDGLVGALEGAFREAPSWELATALGAIVFPTEHTCVDPAPFRKQLKALSRNATLGARPGGTAYMRCAAMARTIASELGVQGEVPRDLFDVYEFVIATVASLGKPSGKHSAKERDS